MLKTSCKCNYITQFNIFVSRKIIGKHKNLESAKSTLHSALFFLFQYVKNLNNQIKNNVL